MRNYHAGRESLLELQLDLEEHGTCKEGLDKDQRSPTKEDELKDNQKGNREGDEIDMCRSRASQRAGMQSLEPPPIHVPPPGTLWQSSTVLHINLNHIILRPWKPNVLFGAMY